MKRTPGERIAATWANWIGKPEARAQLAAEIDRALAAQRRADIRALEAWRKKRGSGARAWIGWAIEVLRERARKGKRGAK